MFERIFDISRSKIFLDMISLQKVMTLFWNIRKISNMITLRVLFAKIIKKMSLSEKLGSENFPVWDPNSMWKIRQIYWTDSERSVLNRTEQRTDWIQSTLPKVGGWVLDLTLLWNKRKTTNIQLVRIWMMANLSIIKLVRFTGNVPAYYNFKSNTEKNWNHG